MFRFRIVVMMTLVLFIALGVVAQDLVIDGRVVDSEHQPVEGAEVNLRPLLGPYQRSMALLERGKPWAASIDRAVTDDQGRYRLEAPDWGLYQVVVEADAYVPVEYRLRPLLEDTTLPTASLKVDEGAVVEVRDGQGRPAEGATIIMEYHGRGPWDLWQRVRGWRPAYRVQHIEADGATVVPYLSGEILEVGILHAGHRPWLGRLQPSDVSLTIDLKTAKAERDVQVDQGGQPLAGALLTRLFLPIAVTDTEGKAALPYNGSVMLWVQSEDGRRRHHTLKPNENRISLEAASWVSGQVVSSDKEQGLAGALVWDDAQTMAVRADQQGRFRWPGDFAEGQLAAAYPGYASVSARHRRDGLERTEGSLRFTLEPDLRLRGRVVDARGQGLAGISVELRRFYGSGSVDQLLQQTSTHRQGHFLFSGLQSGARYEVRAIAPGKATARQVATPRPPSASRVGDIELVLNSSAALTGRVVDDAGQPLEDVQVDLFGMARADGQPFDGIDRDRRSAQPTTSDKNGQFQVSDVPPGRHALALRAAGFAPHILPSISVDAQMGARDLGDLVLEKEAVLDLLVVDSVQNPVPGADVYVRVQHALQAGRDGYPRALQDVLRQQGKTDAEGRLQFGGLRSDKGLSVSIRHPQYVPEERQVQPSDGLVEVILDGGAAIRGQVVDAAGLAVPEAHLTISIESPVQGQRFTGGISMRNVGSSQADGSFEILGVAPGKVTVTAQLQGYEDGNTIVEVTSGEEVESVVVQMQAGLELHGRVVDRQGAAVPGAQVEVRQEPSEGRQRSRGATAQQDGRFHVASLPRGPATLSAVDGQGRRTSQDIVLRPGMAPVRLVLEDGMTLSGRVVDANGQGLRGAEIRLLGLGSMRMVRSGENGRFLMPLEGGGKYTLAATRDDRGWTEQTLEIPEGSSVDNIELTLGAGGRIVGQVSGLEADDLSRLDLRATLQGPQLKFGGMTRHGRVDLDGALTIEGISPGTWRVRADIRGSARRAMQTVQVDRPEDVVVDLDLGEPGVTLSGQILHNGEPAPHAMIDPGSVQADDAGRFRIEGLEPGPYRIHLFGPWGDYVHEGEIYADADVQISIDSFQLAGQVVDSDGQPLEGVEVKCLEAGTPRSMLTASQAGDGGFKVPGLKPGTYQLIAQKPGYGAESITVQLTGDRTDLRITLRSTEAVALRVQGPHVGPVERLSVVVLDASHQPSAIQEVTAEADGLFALDFVPAGSWDLLLMSSRSALGRLSVQVPGGPYTVQLQPKTQLVVRVPDLVEDLTAAGLDIVDGEGRPFNPRMIGMPQAQWPVHRGRFELPLLPPGTWQLTVTAEDGRQWQGSAVTSPEETAEVVLP